MKQSLEHNTISQWLRKGRKEEVINKPQPKIILSGLSEDLEVVQTKQARRNSDPKAFEGNTNKEVPVDE